MKTKYFVFLFFLLFVMIAAGPGCMSNCKKRTGPVTESTLIPGLIKDVEILAIIADTSLYGTEVSANPDSVPPPPWITRFKIPLNSNKLDSLFGPNQNFTVDSVFIDFRGSSLDPIGGVIEIIDAIHQAVFVIPDTIGSWNVNEDQVFMVVKGTVLTASTTSKKAGFFLLPLALMLETSVEGERQINEVIYPDPASGENGFTGEQNGDDTTNGPTTGTDIEDDE